MIKKLSFLAVTVLFTATYLFGQSGLGTLKGTVKDDKTGAVIANAKVYLLSGASMKGNALTDDNGEFQINGILPGSYDVKVTNRVEGYQDALEQGVIISSDKITFLEKLTLGKPENEL
ncbi:MAG: carboxypeptidase-like regulatory domain-containing protein, partial [Bacteroidota bacterium]